MKTIRLITLLLLSMILVSCEEETNFNFTLKYNVEGSNVISSFNNSIKINTVNGPKIIEYIFSDEEKKKIMQTFIDLKIMEEDYTFLKKSYLQVTPCEKNELIVELGDIEFNISWTTNNIPPFTLDPTTGSITPKEGYEEVFSKYKKLVDMKELIIKIAEASEEYKKLPPQMGYQ